MNTISRVETLKLAKTLTESTDIDQLIETSNKIIEYLEYRNVLTDPMPQRFSDFIRKLKIEHPTKGTIDFVPYEFQINLANDLQDNDKIIVNHARMMGIGLIQAVYALWYAMTNSDKTILVNANQYSMALEIMHKIHFSYAHISELERVPLIQQTKGSMIFSNGSKIMARAATGDALRGLSVDLLIVDQTAYLSYSRESDYWTAMSPQLAMGGKVIMTSTPNEAKGLFFNIWGNALTSGFKQILIPWNLHPERDQYWKDRVVNDIGETSFRREYECMFIDR